LFRAGYLTVCFQEGKSTPVSAGSYDHSATPTAFTMCWLILEQSSAHVRTGTSHRLAEAVATFGLLFVILGHRRAQDAPWMVAAWIGGAYWFTASTSFANPAITIARSLSDAFSGIRPVDVPGFLVAQLAGAFLALLVSRSLFGADRLKVVGESLVGASSDPAGVRPT
jgi:glycerol uptake facilitator-like aquaporin